MSYLNSNKVRVFPTAQRETFDPAAKFTTEYNLASLINKLLDTKAFVLSDNAYLDQNDSDILTKLEFNIMGYYFFIENVDLSNLDGYGGTNKFLNATIKINEAQYNAAKSIGVDGNEVTSSLNNWWQLSGSDDIIANTSSYEYKGIEVAWSSTSSFNSEIDDNITSSTSDNVVTYTFTILEKTESSYMIPQESKIRFKTSNSGNKHSLMIDDGELG